MLTLKEISLRQGKRTYLDEVSFTAEAGRITAIVGTRSAGRTELVRVIMGLISPDEGRVELEDFELVGALSALDLYSIIMQQLGCDLLEPRLDGRHGIEPT